MIRVLQCVNDMHRAGLETMLMNYYRNIDRTQIQFDFLTHRPDRSDYDSEIESLGGKVYYAPRLYPQNYPAYFQWMQKFFRDHPEYRIVHSHIDSMSYLPLLAAKRAGVPVRIAHSHNTSIEKNLKFPLKEYFRFRINSVCTDRMACGKAAGEYLFQGESFRIIPNAIDAPLFYYNEEIREKKRSELGCQDQLVIGHAGRFSAQKNHRFLLEIFREIQKKHPESVLLLAGCGELEKEIRRQTGQMKLNGKVLFLGNRSDMNELYQAMDVFVLPSLFEGVPVVGIEAQFADLPCFFSDQVPEEVNFTGNVQFLSLGESPEVWADQILKKAKRHRDRKMQDSVPAYDISNAVGILTECYRSYSETMHRKE